MHQNRDRHVETGPVTPPPGSIRVPDPWQQQAVAALRSGKDVVVQAPTGSGKTLIFELWSNQGKNPGQAIYTVPTRALANDKLSEWRARGWNVGIATGDLAENLDAPVLVATLETQKNRLIRGDGPNLLVIDEYQMLGAEDRGLNYELAMALAPAKTQLLLLSGSVANPHHIVQWFNRLGRQAVLIRHEHRPVPLEEVLGTQLRAQLPGAVRSYWPRLGALALADNLGPVLFFAPRRASAEAIAAELARELPNPNPLVLSEEQRRVVGDHIARLLRARVAYHHSGLSYAARAGVIEPLAKAGQLRAVVATMGLAAGINFSMRSVTLTAASYRRDGQEVPIRSDEILQMFGRAGRRGLDDCGYVIVNANEVGLRAGHSATLARSGMVDWSALLTLMAAAAEQGKAPFAEAVRVQERLFTTKPIFLGVEFSLKHPDAPCGLHTDSERARHVRRRARELLNSRGEWQPYPQWEERPLKEIVVAEYPDKKVMARAAAKAARAKTKADQELSSPGEGVGEFPAAKPAGRLVLRSLLTEPGPLEKIGPGTLVALEATAAGAIYGREVLVGELIEDGHTVVLAKWIRRLTNWNGRQTSLAAWRELVIPIIQRELAADRLPVVTVIEAAGRIVVRLSLAEQTARAVVDVHGIALWRPREREVEPEDCGRCEFMTKCKLLPNAVGTASLWRRLELVDAAGVPTLRGRVTSCFSGGDGLAVAAALEDASYPLDELIYDLTNLDAGFRFCARDDRWGGRLAMACRAQYGTLSVPGYLENGVAPRYGNGAEVVVRAVHRDPYSKHRFTTDFLGDGDIDRIIIEWRSLLRVITHAPPLDYARWTGLQKLAKTFLREVESPTQADLPPLEAHQTQRVDHRLLLRRH